MTGQTEMGGGIKVVGVNHRTAPLDVRERSATGLLLQISNPALDQGLPVRLVKKMPS